jgi:hypothetical protein
MSVNKKMTALADEIRELSGTTASKSIDAMTSDVGAANTEIAEQTELLAQIATALEGKAGGSGGVTLPTLTNPASTSDILSGKEAIDGEGNKITGTIATKTASNLSASGATVTVPAGYYASNATKSVATGSAKTPATTITKNPTISVAPSGLITASVSGTQNVTPTVTAGYVSSGTAGTITVGGSATKQLTTQAAKTVTPSTSSQTAVASGVYTTGAVTVAAIPSNYEDVTTETNAYTTKLTTLETAITALETELEGKASGGSGGGNDSSTINVCSVAANVTGGAGLNTWFTVIDDTGSITTKNMVIEGYRVMGTVECLNVVCGSLFVFESNYYPESYIEGTAECIFTNENYSIFKAPTVAGESCFIDI